ncbi:hypothetical protein BD410DRAFT_513172 [Rickenella mellea]|uniref:Uncharacterized protein n=1 Tax=Rickenella mellea TaxID=50990 RepID=A0A4Y7PRI6_9AGAM|nr:hypothetical protein BD410DRAFT_513172 [Rickenella mellea]
MSIHHTNIRLEPQREGEVNNYYKSFPFLVASPDKEREAWDGYGLSLSPLGFGGRLVRVRNEVTLAEDVYHCQSASRPNFMDFRVACGTSSSASRIITAALIACTATNVNMSPYPRHWIILPWWIHYFDERRQRRSPL